MTKDAVRNCKLSFGDLAIVIMSAKRPNSSVNSFQESIATPLTAKIWSPFLMLIFEAGVLGIMVSISAGTNGRTKLGVAFSIPNKLMSPGKEIDIGLPSRMMSTRLAMEISRNKSAAFRSG